MTERLVILVCRQQKSCGTERRAFAVYLGCALSVSTARIAANSFGVQINEAVISAFMSLFFYKMLHISSRIFVKQARKCALRFFSMVCFAALSGTLHGALDRVGDFALLDDRGTFHQLSRYRHRSALAMMAYDSSCAKMDGMLERFAALSGSYENQGIDFVLLDSRDLGREVARALDLPLPLLEDDGQLVSETLDITRAGDVLVLNPQRLSVYYRGGSSAALIDALNAVVDGSVEDTIAVETAGCMIDFPVRSRHLELPPDYVLEVAPIVINNCLDCHVQGGVGPFAMDSYIMLLGWSPMIREVLLNKRMPPMQVDPYIGHSDSARGLSKQDLQTLIHWIDAGAPRGQGEIDPLEQHLRSDDEWVLGEPDYIVRGPEHSIPSTGVLDYYYSNIELPFTEDKWVKAVQYRAGDPSVLHHLITFVSEPEEDFWGAERVSNSVSRRFVAGYIPGKENVYEFPEGVGTFIPAGNRLSMQFHYVTNGQSTVDQTQLGLYFSDQPLPREQRVQAIGTRFVLPPNTPELALQASHLLDENIMITGVRARMNYRGKKMRFEVEAPSGISTQLFSVPAFNYGWQPHYLLNDPVSVSAGSTLRVTGALDNSASNPTNPDPDLEIPFGFNSWEEMFTGYFTYFQSLD